MNPWRLGENLFIRKIPELSHAELQAWDAIHQADSNLHQAFLSQIYVSHVAKLNSGVRILMGYKHGEPAFFLPLQPRPGFVSRFGVYEPVGGVMTDYFGVVAKQGVKLSPADLLGATRGRINAVLFTHLDEAQAAFGLSGYEKRIGLRTWLGQPVNEYWNCLRAIDKKLVTDTERREKKFLKEIGPLIFEWRSSTPSADMEWLIEAKKAQYSRTGKTHAPLFDHTNAELLRRLSSAQDAACGSVLSVLRCGNEIVAAHFGLTCQGTLHVWFPVYNKQYAKYSPGRILFKNMFSAAAKDGITVFDRGEGDSQAKRDFANVEHQYTRGLWSATGLSGWAASLAVGLAWRLEKA